MKKLIVRILVIFILLTMIGCSANPTNVARPDLASGAKSGTLVSSNTTTPQPQPTTNGAYPAPLNLDSSYPSPNMDALPNINNPGSQVAVIRGKIIHDKPGAAAIFPNLYVAEVKSDANGNPMVASLDRSAGVKALVDKQGNFVIQDIKPDKYVLIIDLVENIMMLNDESGKERILVLEGGKILDVGVIHIP